MTINIAMSNLPPITSTLSFAIGVTPTYFCQEVHQTTILTHAHAHARTQDVTHAQAHLHTHTQDVAYRV
jgi:hypothetical protein